jgi:hypothetical protein
LKITEAKRSNYAALLPISEIGKIGRRSDYFRTWFYDVTGWLGDAMPQKRKYSSKKQEWCTANHIPIIHQPHLLSTE